MKFKITAIQNQDYSQINVLVDIMTDANVLLVKRVFTLPFEKYSNMDDVTLTAWITNEVKVAKESQNNETLFKTLINQVVTV